LIGFLVWKLYPLVPWWSAVLEDPIRLLRLPGGRVGTLLGALAAGATLAPYLLRRRQALRPALVSMLASALGAVIALGAIQALATPPMAGDSSSVLALTGQTLSHRQESAEVPVVSDTVPTVVTFWATWCGPCRAELPVKKAAFENSGDSFQMVSVNMTHTEGTTDHVRRYVAEHDIQYPVFLDTHGELASRMGVRGTPTTIVFASDGRVLDRWMGPSTLGRLNRAVADAPTMEE
jgi:thiol-disulfide isomerase/thioredoxin